MWERIVENALIGTGKVKPEESMLQVSDIFDDFDSFDDEAKLLSLSSVALLYNEAGRLPAQFSGEFIEYEQRESRAIADYDYIQLFYEIESLHRSLDKDFVFAKWLDKLISQKKIVPPQFINRLLAFGSKMTHETKRKVITAIGEKGKWLLEFRSDLMYQTPQWERDWEEGDTKTRLTALEELRKTNPDVAEKLIQKTWSSEPITTKNAILQLILRTFHSQDRGLLESIYANDFIYHSKEKKADKECRNLVVLMLLNFSDSAPYIFLSERLEPYFPLKKTSGLLSFISKKEEISIDLPTDEDETWSVLFMDKHLGITKNASSSALYPSTPLYFLAKLIEITPFSFWEKLLQRDLKQTLSYLVDSPEFIITLEGKKTSLFLAQFINNGIIFRNLPLLEILLEKTVERYKLLKHVSQEVFEKFVSKNNLWADTSVIHTRETVDELWSVAFSETLLKSIYSASKSNDFRWNEATTRVLSRKIPLAVFENLKEGENLQYTKYIYEPLTEFKNILSKIYST